MLVVTDTIDEIYNFMYWLLALGSQEMKSHNEPFCPILHSGAPGVRAQHHLLLEDGQRRIARDIPWVLPHREHAFCRRQLRADC